MQNIKMNGRLLQNFFFIVATGFFVNCGTKTSDTATTTTATATFSSINTSILKSTTYKCQNCHAASVAAALGGNIKLDTHANVIASTSVVNKTTPANSTLYTRVILAQSNALAMPPSGAGTSLSAADAKAILDWITAGALND